MNGTFSKIGRISYRSIAIAITVLLTLWLLAAAYGGMLNPLTSPAGALIAMTFPAALLIMLISLVVNLFFFKKLAAANLLALMACAGPVYTYCPVNLPAHASDSDSTFTLMSYNVYDFDYGNDASDSDTLNAALQYIINADPDIVCLQESNHLSHLGRWRFDRSQIDTVNRRYPYQLYRRTGLALLSKFPADTVTIDHSVFGSLKWTDFDCYRINIYGRPVYIFNVHLQSIGLTQADKKLYRSILSAHLDRDKISEARRQLLGKLSEAFRQRTKQARSLRNQIDSLGGTVIICGDFNDIPGCYATRTVKRGDMTDAYRHAGFGPAITYHENRYYFRIDHIFYRGDIEAIDADRDRVMTSDHYPLRVTFELTPPQ